MPLIDFNLREGSLEPDRLEWLMPRLTKTLMYWEKMPDTPWGRGFEYRNVGTLRQQPGGRQPRNSGADNCDALAHWIDGASTLQRFEIIREERRGPRNCSTMIRKAPNQ